MTYARTSHTIALGAILLPLTTSCIGQGPSENGASAPLDLGQIVPDPTRSVELGGQSIDFCHIAPGEFTMGNNKRYVAPGQFLKGVIQGWAETTRQDEGPEHSVTITKGYYLASTKVWVSLYCEFLNSVEDADSYIALNKFSFIEKGGDRFLPKPDCDGLAVNTVPWVGAVAFCEWASEQTELVFRLPTEAEWEFAASGEEGSSVPWRTKREGEDVRYYHRPKERGFSPLNYDPVGTHPDNATPEGIMDMIGPTAEWCSDYYREDYEKGPSVDPTGPTEPDPSLTSRVLRGRGHATTDRARGPETVDRLTDGLYGFRVLLEGGG